MHPPKSAPVFLEGVLSEIYPSSQCPWERRRLANSEHTMGIAAGITLYREVIDGWSVLATLSKIARTDGWAGSVWLHVCPGQLQEIPSAPSLLNRCPFAFCLD